MNYTPSRFNRRRPKGRALFRSVSHDPVQFGQTSKCRLTIALALALVLARAAGGAPQNSPSRLSAQPASPQASQPALHSVTHLVEVNVIVQDKKGDPVTDLTKDDFELVDQGKPQAISLFSMESTHILPASATLLAPNIYSNRLDQQSGLPTSITVILIDALNTYIIDMNYARAQLTKYLK